MLPKIKTGILNSLAPKKYEGLRVDYEDKLLDGATVHSLCGKAELVIKANPSVKFYSTKQYYFRTQADPSKCFPIIPSIWLNKEE